MANKETYLYLKALELCDNTQKQDLLNLFSGKETIETEKVNSVKQILIELNIPLQTKELILEYNKTAISHLDKVNSDNKFFN